MTNSPSGVFLPKIIKMSKCRAKTAYLRKRRGRGFFVILFSQANRTAHMVPVPYGDGCKIQYHIFGRRKA